jgi:hypothetical protein
MSYGRLNRSSFQGGLLVEAGAAQLLEIGTLYRLRSAQGVLALADKHGSGRDRALAWCYS